MEYTQRDFELMGRQVVAGKYIARTTFFLSLALVFIAGCLAGRMTAPDADPAPLVEVERPLESSSPSFKAATGNQQLIQSILAHEEQARSEPQNAEVWAHLGDLYYDASEPQKAVNAYEKSLAITPENTSALVDCGVMYRELKNYDKALGYFSKALQLDPKHEVARFNTGVVLYHDLGRKEEGVAAWKALVSLNPQAKTPGGVLVSAMLKDLESR